MRYMSFLYLAYVIPINGVLPLAYLGYVIPISDVWHFYVIPIWCHSYIWCMLFLYLSNAISLQEIRHLPFAYLAYVIPISTHVIPTSTTYIRRMSFSYLANDILTFNTSDIVVFKVRNAENWLPDLMTFW